MNKLLYLMIIFLIVTSSCVKKIATLIKSTTELLPIQNELVKKYKDPNINVNLDSNFGEKGFSIGVEFVNTALNDKEKEARIEAANETLNLIKDNYKSIDEISKIYIKFINDKNYVVVNTSREENYLFEKDKNNSWQMIEVLEEE